MKTEVLIAGGGIAGLSLAVLLGKAGLSITVIEPHQLVFTNIEKHFGRTAALMGGSINVLKALGIWGELEKQTAPLQVMRIIDDSKPNHEPVTIDFAASEAGYDSFGYNIPNLMLHEKLAHQIDDIENIRIIQAKLETIQVKPNTITAKLDNGEVVETTLLVGADGKKSVVRALAGIKTKENNYRQSAITCLIEHSKPHGNISTEHHRPGGPFTTVPMPDKNGKHLSSVVWVEKEEDAENYLRLDKGAFEKALQKRTRNALGEIKLASDPECWPLKGIIADKITAPRIALIAEAAHAMSPIGAQGLNLSLRDVASLSEVIIDARRLGEDIGKQTILEKYAKRRHLDIVSRYYGVDSYNRIVSNNLGFLRELRKAGLKTLKTVPAFKNIAMHQGLQPANDEGRIMRGESL
jgi:2-octaprenyl-6-methoxyphenol hydroxylase